MTLTHKELVEVLKCLEDSSCEEFSLQMEGVDLLLRRQVAGSAPAPRPEPRSRKPREEPAAEKAQDAPTVARKQSAPAHDPAPTTASDAGEEVLAPMSGTFYRRPAPDANPFVEVGSEVQKGDPLCMIEVMKLFSTVYAETVGRVTAIRFSDGDAVETGQVLVVIEAAAG